MTRTAKLLLAAVAVFSAFGANAAISAGAQGNGEPGGELFLTVWDPVNQVTYTRDLGIDVLGTDFSTASFSLAADGLYTATFGGVDASTLQYSVVGTNNDLVNAFVLGVWTTSNSPGVDIPVNEFAALNTITQNVGNYVFGANDAAGDASDFAADNSSIITDTSDAGYYDNALNFAGNLGGVASFTTGASVGDALSFYSLVISNDTGGALAVTQFDGSWLLDANGTLTYSAAAPVPVPAAVWLMGSGLVTLMGLRRRKSA